MKRTMDITAAALGLLVLAPLLLAIALAVGLTMGRPIFFRQRRPGRGGRPFEILKFRTMLPLRGPHDELQPDVQRITWLGRLLRDSSLDELPELFNVLWGDMSLVGPRPLLMRYLDRYSPRQARRHDVRPGITGLAQISGRNAISWEEKFDLDVWYIEHWSLPLDCRILWKTFAKVLRREGVDATATETMPEFWGSGEGAGAGGQWSGVSGQGTEVSGQWSVVSGQKTENGERSTNNGGNACGDGSLTTDHQAPATDHRPPTTDHYSYHWRPAGRVPMSAARPDMPRVYLSPPHMSGAERELLLDAFDSNWIAPLGPHVDAFEREFAAKVGMEHAVALSSGTAALHLALLLAGIGPGDEVATSTFTFAATANAIRYVGATPVFIDSEPATWNLDPELLAAELDAAAGRGRPLRAVLSVDVLGQCADYEPLAALCRRHGLPLIEDAAEALGATYAGRPAGTLGDLGCFSFNGNKIITTSGGGMLITRRKDWADRARFLATQARDPAPHYEHSHIGYNYRLSNLLAAVGRGQLQRLEHYVARRRENFRCYQEALGDLPGLEFMPEGPRGRSTRWLTCITVDPARFGASREDIRLALESENIEARPLWKPMHVQPVFAACRARGGGLAQQLFQQGLCLPSGSSLTAADRGRVVAVIRRLGPRALAAGVAPGMADNVSPLEPDLETVGPGD